MRKPWFRKQSEDGETEEWTHYMQEREENDQKENRIVRLILRVCILLALWDVACYVVFAYTHSVAAFILVGFLMALVGCYIWIHS